jgi:hypothetical protein
VKAAPQHQAQQSATQHVVGGAEKHPLIAIIVYVSLTQMSTESKIQSPLNYPLHFGVTAESFSTSLGDRSQAAAVWRSAHPLLVV